MRTSCGGDRFCGEHRDRTLQEPAVIAVSLAIMGRNGHVLTVNRPAHVRKLFKCGESLALCKASLADAPASYWPVTDTTTT